MPEASLRHHHRLRNILITCAIVPISLFLALMVLAFVINIFDRSDRISRGDYSLDPVALPTSTAAPATDAYSGATKALIEGSGNPSIGAADPKVTIVEFSDFQCPFCLSSFPALREVSLKHADTVKVIFRDWPGHENSLNLALGAHCAAEQGKFWEMHDKLFQSQSDTFGANKNDLALLAQQLGIYNPQFQNCFDSQKYLPLIKQNFQDADTLGVKGTPTWFFNGHKVAGQMTTADLENFISKF